MTLTESRKDFISYNEDYALLLKLLSIYEIVVIPPKKDL